MNEYDLKVFKKLSAIEIKQVELFFKLEISSLPDNQIRVRSEGVISHKIYMALRKYMDDLENELVDLYKKEGQLQ